MGVHKHSFKTEPQAIPAVLVSFLGGFYIHATYRNAKDDGKCVRSLTPILFVDCLYYLSGCVLLIWPS